MDITFTCHAEFRIMKRKILAEEVIDAIKQPDITVKKHGIYYFTKNIGRGKIEAVCEKTESNINVITVYWV
jgi:hypothetical protein